MTRPRAQNEWILGNGNLWAGQRSLLVGHPGKPFFRQIKNRGKNMEQTAYSPQKGRLETMNNDFRYETITWFDDHEKAVEGDNVVQVR